MSRMIKFFKEHMKEFFLTIMMMLAVIMICCVLMLINNYEEGLYQQAIDSASFYSSQAGELLDEQINKYVEDVKKLADGLPNDSASIKTFLYDYQDKNYEYIPAIRVFANGYEYSSRASLYDPKYAITSKEENASVLSLAERHETAVTGFFTASDSNSNVFAVYVPVKNNEALDGLVVFYYAAELENDIVENFKTLNSSVMPNCLFVINQSGLVSNVLIDNEFGYVEKYQDFNVELREMTNKSTVDDFNLKKSEGYADEISVDSVKYVICVHPSKVAGDSICLISFYNSYNVYSEGHSLASSIGAIIITIMSIVISLAIYIVVANSRLAKQLDNMEFNDADLGCPNSQRFLRRAPELYKQYKGSKYAVIYLQISHWSYIYENLGEETARTTLLFLSKLLEKTIADAECFCHMSNETFAVLLHYRDLDELKDRLGKLSDIAFNCPVLKQQHFFLKLIIGIYCLEMDPNIDIQKMIDRAAIASRSTSASQVDNMRIYDQEIHAKYLHEAEIESIMRNSLKSGEFKVFFQPKYNVAKNKPDGAEALSRWYDSKNNRFRTPNEFIPIFEANGFIADVDKYVFEQVCKFIRESIDQGYRMVPISVNISRVTATQQGFTDFIIATKRKYGIMDRYISLEFAEAFANENYELVSNIVSKCHQNGFLCAIDNFGSGFSSYNILKDLAMDEIKLDRFFILPGVSKDRDHKLLSSVVALAKNLNMKVTQQGVESVDDYKRLVSFGCDVIQGYIYSKPVPATDFVQFIQSGGQMTII